MVTKKTGNVGVSNNVAVKTTAKVGGKAVSTVPLAATKRVPSKTYRVVLTPVKGENKMVVTSVPGKVLEASTRKQGKTVKLKLSRSSVVGKYELTHLPAPKTKLKLDDEKRKLLLASMRLI